MYIDRNFLGIVLKIGFVLLFWMLLGSLPFSAMAFTGIYSCSAGDWNGKPVTYVFNEELMLRDDDKSSPFELLGEAEDGTRLYFGKVFDPQEDARLKSLHYPDIDSHSSNFALNSDLATYTLFAFTNSFEEIKTVDDYILHAALACNLGGHRLTMGELDQNSTLLFSLVQDRAEAEAINAKSCSWKTDYATNRGIEDIRKHFVQRITAKREELATKNTIISVKPGEEFLFEAPLTGVVMGTSGYLPPKRYNCNVLSIQTPKIEKPKESFKKAGL